jgi:hypothetical protein
MDHHYYFTFEYKMFVLVEGLRILIHESALYFFNVLLCDESALNLMFIQVFQLEWYLWSNIYMQGR